MGCEALQHSSRSGAIVRADAIQRVGDRRFNGSRTDRVGPSTPPGQAKHGAPSIARVVDSIQQPLLHEPLQHAGERTGIDVKRRGEIAGRQSGRQAHHSQDETLRTGDAEIAAHALRAALEAMRDGPEPLHEMQHIGQRIGSGFSCLWSRCHHGNYFELKLIHDIMNR